MARKKKHEEHENLERWLVSYADFITLLFAFFVVMYSVSAVNEGKFRAMSSSMTAAFNPSSYVATNVQIGPRLSAPESISSQVEAMAGLKRSVKNLEKKGNVRVFQDGRGIVVRMVDILLFDSGRADLLPDAVTALDEIAEILKTMPYAIRVEGHTDNVPIHTPVYPSNWELSSARAIQIVKRFIEDGLSPMDLEAVGYGEFRPIVAEGSPEDLAQNRRVDIVVLKKVSSKTTVHPFANLSVK
jgi:chemotaxis protein MotB